jgi:hypothetical protein
MHQRHGFDVECPKLLYRYAFWLMVVAWSIVPCIICCVPCLAICLAACGDNAHQEDLDAAFDQGEDVEVRVRDPARNPDPAEAARAGLEMGEVILRQGSEAAI